MLREMSRGVPLAVLALSCAGAPRAIDAPHEPVLQVRLYAPLAMKVMRAGGLAAMAFLVALLGYLGIDGSRRRRREGGHP